MRAPGEGAKSESANRRRRTWIGSDTSITLMSSPCKLAAGSVALPGAVYYDVPTAMSEAVQAMLQTNAEAARETEREADPGFLCDFWYPAVRCTEITGRRLATAMLLEGRLVRGRW